MSLLSFCRNLLSSPPESRGKSNSSEADPRDADAQFGLGLHYGSGHGRDSEQAASWYRKAADQDHPLAQFNLGLMYAAGHGVARDDAQALSWIRKAAHGGDAGAQHHMGGRCHRASLAEPQGDAPESRVEAYKWFFLASAQGYKDSAAACERVALCMTSHEVVEGNHRAAAFVLRKDGVKKATE